MPKIIVVADLVLGPSFTEPDVKQFVLENLPYWVDIVISRTRTPEAGYGLKNSTVYYGLEDFDADRAEGVDHFASEGEP